MDTTTITVSYHRRAAAERFRLAARIQALPNGHPVKHVVAFMALYARDVLRGDLPGPYTDERARTFARLALVGPDTYAAHHDDAGITDPAMRAELVKLHLQELQRSLVRHWSRR